MILTTPLPDGLVVFSVLLFGHILLAYSVSLMVAMQVESEGWNIFAMIASNLLINPLIMLLGQIDAIAKPAGGEAIVWSLPAVAILSAQLLLSLAALAFTLWWHGRKTAFY